jgi:hypothetical protein
MFGESEPAEENQQPHRSVTQIRCGKSCAQDDDAFSPSIFQERTKTQVRLNDSLSRRCVEMPYLLKSTKRVLRPIA